MLPDTTDDTWVVHYDFSKMDRATAREECQQLIHDLSVAGLTVEVRPADGGTSVLLFARARPEALEKEVHKSRMKDWLYSITNNSPYDFQANPSKGETEAENLRSVYHMVTWTKAQGGAGIIAGEGQWKNVKSTFPLHNQHAIKNLLRRWTHIMIPGEEDLDEIRAIFGEKIALYFAFLRTYVLFLIFPSVTGIFCYIFLSNYSLAYAIMTSLWCTIFLEYWRQEEIQLSIRWGVRGVGSLKLNRPQYVWEQEVYDPITGQHDKYFPTWKRIVRQLLQIPFALVASISLGALITLIFAVEIFISEVYNGPLKAYLEYVPSIFLAIAIPFITEQFDGIASWLSNYENHRTQDSYENAKTQKLFVLNFTTSFLPLFLTAFVYIPFGEHILPYLNIFGTVMRPFLKGETETELRTTFQVDPSRLRNEMIALTLTGQVLHLCEELIFPHIKRVTREKYRSYRRHYQEAQQTPTSTPTPTIALHKRMSWQPSPPSAEEVILQSARNQAELDTYNVQDDYLEMVLQFGYLALFSPVWPLVPIGFLINNWVELRSDLFKLCHECKRPPPIRLDSIGPWIEALGFLTWLGSLTTVAIVYLFREQPNASEGGNPRSWWTLPLLIFFSEHVYLIVRYLTGLAMGQLGSKAKERERRERYGLRKKYLDEVLLESSQGPVRTATTDSEVFGMETNLLRARIKRREKLYHMESAGQQEEELEAVESALSLIDTLKGREKTRIKFGLENGGKKA